MTFPIALLAFAVTCLWPQRAEGQVQRVPFRLTHMSMQVRVDYDRQAISGTVTLHLRNVGTRAASRIPLLLNRLMVASAVTRRNGTTVPFTQDVVVFDDDSLRQVNAVVVALPQSVRAGDSTAIVVRYSGRLVGYTETGALYIRDHVDREFTILREDALAFPIIGVPSWAANGSTPSVPFTFAAQVTVPTGQVVATGGQLVATSVQDSTTTFTYKSERPVPFLNIAIAPFRVLERDGLRIFHFEQDSAGAASVQRAVREATAQYAQWYGPLHQDLDLTIIEIPEGWGSQASLSGGIIQTADAFRSREQLAQVYHELSHLWNVADLDKPSARWNEGLASFLQWRMAAQLDGWDGWDAWLSRMQEALKSSCAPDSRCATTPYAEYGRAGLTDMSYRVGAAMFWLLYQAMGADVFDRTYREFFQRHHDSGAHISDFVKTFEAASPAARCILSDWFFTTRWQARLSQGESLPQMLQQMRERSACAS